MATYNIFDLFTALKTQLRTNFVSQDSVTYLKRYSEELYSEGVVLQQTGPGFKSQSESFCMV